MEKSSVVLKDIVKEFRTHDGSGVFRAVNQVTATIEAGDFVTLLGPSGCGKTTILRMIAGFESPTSGDIYIGGRHVNSLTPDKRNTAMVFQSYALFPHYNVYDNIAYGLKLKSFAPDAIKKKVAEILALVGLEGLEARSPNQLSGGQQQRVALARALVMEPAVLLFDEPLSNLDAKLRVYMRKEIRKIQRTLGVTSIYVTHDQAEAMSLSDKVIVMNKGRIEQIGSPTEIYQKPATEFVADFIGAANFIDGVVAGVSVEGLTVEILGRAVTVPYKGGQWRKGDKVKVVARPEAIKIGREGMFTGRVVSSTFMGPVQEYQIAVGGQQLYVEEANPVGKELFEEEAEIGFSFREGSLHVVKPA